MPGRTRTAQSGGPSHHYMSVINPGRLIIIRVPYPMPSPWRSAIVAPLTRSCRNRGSERRTSLLSRVSFRTRTRLGSGRTMIGKQPRSLTEPSRVTRPSSESSGFTTGLRMDTFLPVQAREGFLHPRGQTTPGVSWTHECDHGITEHVGQSPMRSERTP